MLRESEGGVWGGVVSQPPRTAVCWRLHAAHAPTVVRQSEHDVLHHVIQTGAQSPAGHDRRCHLRIGVWGVVEGAAALVATMTADRGWSLPPDCLAAQLPLAKPKPTPQHPRSDHTRSHLFRVKVDRPPRPTANGPLRQRQARVLIDAGHHPVAARRPRGSFRLILHRVQADPVLIAHWTSV